MSDLPRRGWSPEEVGEQLGIKYHTVLRMIRSGQLGAIKVGRYYRIPDFEFERLLRSAEIAER